MIIVRIGIQDGEREYNDWNYYNNFTQTDYLEGKITDNTIEIRDLKGEILKRERFKIANAHSLNGKPTTRS